MKSLHVRSRESGVEGLTAGYNPGYRPINARTDAVDVLEVVQTDVRAWVEGQNG